MTIVRILQSLPTQVTPDSGHSRLESLLLEEAYRLEDDGKAQRGCATMKYSLHLAGRHRALTVRVALTA
jgi:hypothetical protein